MYGRRGKNCPATILRLAQALLTTADHVVLLNPDCFVEPSKLRTMAKAMARGVRALCTGRAPRGRQHRLQATSGRVP
ncbi:MAG: hypothetical protein IT532_03510 [Burkholderiales bacterium]|nr:hypothetical protein [Burkholderiales bacterium]